MLNNYIKYFPFFLIFQLQFSNQSTAQNVSVPNLFLILFFNERAKQKQTCLRMPNGEASSESALMRDT